MNFDTTLARNINFAGSVVNRTPNFNQTSVRIGNRNYTIRPVQVDGRVLGMNLYEILPQVYDNVTASPKLRNDEACVEIEGRKYQIRVVCGGVQANPNNTFSTAPSKCRGAGRRFNREAWEQHLSVVEGVLFVWLADNRRSLHMRTIPKAELLSDVDKWASPTCRTVFPEVADALVG